MFTLIVRIVHNTGAAAELTLDVSHDIWRCAGTHDAGGTTILGWVLNQARSRAIDRLITTASARAADELAADVQQGGER